MSSTTSTLFATGRPIPSSLKIKVGDASSDTNRSRTNIADQSEHAATLALRALAWTLSEETRARRLLDLTGLEAGELRARAADPAVLAAVLAFLQAHQPDLVACAEALEVPPERLVAAQEALGSRQS